MDLVSIIIIKVCSFMKVENITLEFFFQFNIFFVLYILFLKVTEKIVIELAKVKNFMKMENITKENFRIMSIYYIIL